MNDETEGSYTFEQFEKGFFLLHECLSVNQVKKSLAFSVFLNMISYHYHKEGLSFEQFQDKMKGIVEECRWRWEKKE